VTKKLKRQIILATLKKFKIQLAKFSHPQKKEKKEERSQDRCVWGHKNITLC
jgi:hypothetical protein